ncbi:MAG: OmpA family protein [Ignavibacterium sp.]|jgi:outer membrane protein OmpA-like peptidoglycan-associated protein|nr:OmpA family protein [Ignavibacterium sp.]
MKKLLFALFLIPSTTFTSFSQNDADGCKDHALLTRLNNFYLASCEENFNELELRLDNNKTEIKEGNLFSLDYVFNSDAGEKPKSPLQIIKNFENAIVKNGGKMLYKNTNALDADLEATYYLSTKEKEYWVRLFNFGGTPNEVERFTLYVLEMESMKQEIEASEMFEAINKNGFIALYINFETGKSTIKQESQNIIDELFSMLNENATLKIVVEGHTDNVGNSSSNKTLSEQRALSVKDALVNKGISAERIEAVGYGQDKPIADNTTEEGRTKNRRVEIKKQ